MRISPTIEQVQDAFEQVAGSPVFAESAVLVRQGRMPAEMIQAMSLRPEFLAAFSQLSGSLYPGGIIEREIKELIILESSRQHACQFCTGSHVDIVRQLGMSDAPLELLDDPGMQTDRQRHALAYARAVMDDANRIPGTIFESLHKHFSGPEIVELTLMVGFISMLNLFNNSLGVRYHGEYMD